MVSLSAHGVSCCRYKKVGAGLALHGLSSFVHHRRCPSNFLPAAGNRNNGSTNNQGTNGNYWSSSCNTGTNNAYRMNFDSSSFNPQNNNNRYNGYTVRPVLSSAVIDVFSLKVR